VEWFWWDCSLSQWPTGFLQCLDSVGWVIWPVKIVHEMTYKVSSGRLYLCLLTHVIQCTTTYLISPTLTSVHIVGQRANRYIMAFHITIWRFGMKYRPTFAARWTSVSSALLQLARQSPVGCGLYHYKQSYKSLNL